MLTCLVVEDQHVFCLIMGIRWEINVIGVPWVSVNFQSLNEIC
jgi:hypothetical protein